MKLRFTCRSLDFRWPFSIHHGTRQSTPVVFTRVEHQGMFGYGEANMPPYLGESHETASRFLAKAGKVLEGFSMPAETEKIISAIDSIEKENLAAKASVDIALHDLQGKQLGIPCRKMFGIKSNTVPYTSFTIGISDEKSLREKIKEAKNFRILKVKLGSSDDKKIIRSIRALTDKPLCVDANQGWSDPTHALEMIHFISENNTLFVEQPLPKNNIDGLAWLKDKSPLPLIADESCQRLADIEKVKDSFHGVNVKLMKSTGMFEAHQMILQAKKMDMKVLIGCMSESSCAVAAAAHLSPLCDWADLDGPFLIRNDFFTGLNFSEGRIVPGESPGLGVHLLNENIFS